MLEGQQRAGPHPGLMHAGAVHHGIGPGEINVLKHAQAGLAFAAVLPDGADAPPLENHDLARVHVPDQGGAHGVQGAAFAGQDEPAVRPHAVAQGAEAVGVPGGDELAGGHDHQGIRALDLVHGAAKRLLDGGGGKAFLGDDVGNDLGVGGGVENGASQLQFFPQVIGIDQVSVVAQGHGAFHVVHHDGLGVGPAGAAGGAVAHVADGHVALAQLFHFHGGEHVVHQPGVLMGGEDPVVVHHDAAAFLAPVLQGEKAVVYGGRHVALFRGQHAENAAFFM